MKFMLAFVLIVALISIAQAEGPVQPTSITTVLTTPTTTTTKTEVKTGNSTVMGVNPKDQAAPTGRGAFTDKNASNNLKSFAVASLVPFALLVAKLF